MPKWMRFHSLNNMSYFEDYEDMFSEPSKAEQIIEDAKAALWNELTEETKQVMDNANEARTKSDEIRNEISYMNWQKAQLEEEIKQLREQKIYVEAHEVPARQVKAIVNHLTKDFRPGDECWVIDAKYDRHTCEKCGGKKRVQATIGGETMEVECPACRGRGSLEKTIHYVRKDSVRNVTLWLRFDNYNRTEWETDPIYLRDSIYGRKVDGIFKTEEEAKAAIAERYGGENG